MKKRSFAFTLIELLVVIGVIALLIAVLLPTLSRSRLLAQRARAGSNLHQIMIAYGGYSTENEGDIFPGFPPSSVNGATVVVQDVYSGLTIGPPASQRYPWRLVAASNLPWKLLYSHTTVPTLPTPGDPNKTLEAYLLSLTPSFGLNSVYVGGDIDSGPNGLFQGYLSNGFPNTGHHVVFKNSEVRSPSSLIVFAETQVKYPTGLGGSDPIAGYFRVNPPRANGQSWDVQNGKIRILASSFVQTAIPQGRYGDLTETAFFDGHVDALSATDLVDMRLWANDATTPDYDFATSP